MIALTAAALAAPCPAPPAVHLAAGPDLWNAWPSRSPDGRWTGLDVERVDPGWSGAGGDVVVLLPTRVPCLRAGVREQLAWHAVQDATMWSDGRFTGSESHWITSVTLGAEVALPAWFAVGAHLVPGVRTVVTHQRAVVPERGLDRTETHLSFVPTLSVSAVVRWFPAQGPVGLHADAELPLLHPLRELGWYPHRFVGVGLDLRVGRAGAG